MADSPIRTLLPVRQFSEKHTAWSSGSLRHLIDKAKDRHSSIGVVPGNGLERAIVRVGRRVLIDEARFFEWVDSQQSR